MMEHDEGGNGATEHEDRPNKRRRENVARPTTAATDRAEPVPMAEVVEGEGEHS